LTTAYRDYVRTLSTRFEAEFSQIKAGYNFDYGDEFEVAVALALRAALPDSYGVVRGHLVDMDGNQAGDDIIIYERSRFPTFGLRKADDFSRKEFVPIEAAYCYIEAKHSLSLTGSGEGTLAKSFSQVSDAKRLASKRPAVPLSQISPYINVGPGLSIQPLPNFPSQANPFFGMVLTRAARPRVGEAPFDDPASIADLVVTSGVTVDFPPDCAVIGSKTILLPARIEQPGNKAILESPFHLPGRTLLTNHALPGTAFGVGLLMLLSALDWIRLGTLPWKSLVADALGIPLVGGG
jgi:uncharacterized protein DUF6602